MPPKQRILLEQRRALRVWAHSQHPRPSQKACIAWFQNKYGLKISQSTVSESLSSHFEAVDSTTDTQRSRLRTGQWPDLEKLLFLWQQRVEERGGMTSGDLLRQKAQDIWHQLPQYSTLPCPEFSVGWLQNFKKRHHIRNYNQHGELGSVPELAEEEMKALRTLGGEYKEEDIYNMDETALFWRMVPSRGLSTQSRPGIKKDKSRITLVFAVNSSGSDRVPVWIIGKYKSPRALKNVNVSTMGGEWRWNSKAWMNTAIMCEWLQAFYTRIGRTREILLTMDNFSAHISALELTPPPPNIRIAWLPKNSTSRFQPLDQGIIQSFKAQYRRQWLGYMLGCYERDENPLDSMNLYLAIRWIIRSWNHYVSNTTIYNCFRKSTLMSAPINLPISIEPLNITSLYDKVQKAGHIQDIMALSNFLNPIEENKLEAEDLNQNSDEILQDILNEHLGVQQDEDSEGEGEQLGKPERSIQDAIQALKVVIEFAEGSDSVQTAHLRAFERVEQELESLVINSRTQSTLDGWMM